MFNKETSNFSTTNIYNNLNNQNNLNTNSGNTEITNLKQNVEKTTNLKKESWIMSTIKDLGLEIIFSILFAPIKYFMLLLLFLLIVWIIGGTNLLLEWLQVLYEITKIIYNTIVNGKV
ncbi:hypothetical protein ABK040_010467 [Willaertia magna]